MLTQHPQYTPSCADWPEEHKIRPIEVMPHYRLDVRLLGHCIKYRFKYPTPILDIPLELPSKARQIIATFKIKRR